MDQRISLITLGLRDLDAPARSTKRSVGEAGRPMMTSCFSKRADGPGLWDRTLLAEDSGMSDAGGWGGVTLAYIVASPRLVDDSCH